MDNEKQVNVVLHSEVGNGSVEVIEKQHYHVLESFTTTFYQTGHLGSFFKFISGKNVKLYYCYDSIYAFSGEFNKYNNSPIAKCVYSTTDYISNLFRLNKQSFGLESFKENLVIFRKFLDGDGHLLLDQIDDLKLSKVEKITRQKGRNGNFMFSVIKENGAGDMDFTKSIKFIVPILDWEECSGEFEFQFEFDYSVDSEKEVHMDFKLYSYEFKTQVNEYIKSHIESLLEKYQCKEYYWGSFEVENHTDQWKYKKA